MLTLSLLALLALPGCMALDEIDKASSKMPSSSKSAKASKAEAAKGEAAAPNPLVEQSKEWWNSATSLSTKNVNASIVRCRMPSGTNFMAKDDCLGRGGVPEGV